MATIHIKIKAKKPVARWSAEDRQSFADRDFLRSSTIPNKKREARRKACRRGNWD